MLNKEYTIILASASPRRRELLAQIGIAYQVMVSDADETASSQKPWEMVEEISARKAEAVLKKILTEEGRRAAGVQRTGQGQSDLAGQGKSDSFVLVGADTVVALGQQIMGKPKGKEDAVRMLSLLQGRTHQVYTGVTLLIADGGESKPRRLSFHEKTEVTMYPMSREEICAYVESGEPMDKAGAYGIQGRCAAFIRGICGDYNNVVGLPVGRLYQELKENI